jgi:hypothetical protein
VGGLGWVLWRAKLLNRRESHEEKKKEKKKEESTNGDGEKKSG